EQRELAVLQQQQATQINAGVGLASGQQAGVKTAENGVTVIDIAAPSQRGVSHNRLNSFNVPAAGLILNNSKDPMISILGGWTDGNRRLTAGSASLILAEVTGSSRSTLLGYTEVLGNSAEFVLANPNGISCNGCGFINTPRVVLATGIPQLLNGELAGIQIGDGNISIDGAGLNASNISKVDILTRAMQLNAALYANELNIRTGANYYDYQTGQLQPGSVVGQGRPAYQFALDASALGAMYANTISLIGTEAGLGVRSEGLLNAVDSLQLTADGQLQLKDTIAGTELTLRSAQSDITTTGISYGQTVDIGLAGTLNNSGLIAAADRMQISASALQQSGDLIAGMNIQGEWLNSGEQQLDIAASAVNQGRIISQGQQLISARQLSNATDAILQASVTALTAAELSNEGAVNSEALAITADSVQSRGHIQARQLGLDVQQFTLLDGSLYQTGDSGQLQFSGQNLNLTGGVIVTEGAVQLSVSEQLANQADWLSAGNTTITAGRIINSGTLELLAGADLTATRLNNSGEMAFSGAQSASIVLEQQLSNQGLLQFAADATVAATSINNDDGQIYHLGSGDLSLQAAQQLTNQNGQLLSNGNLQLSATQLDNRQGSISAFAETGESLRLNISTVLDNRHGSILSKGQHLTLNSAQILNQQGSVLLAGTEALTITAAEQLQNEQGLIHSAGSLALTTPLLNNLQGVIQAEGSQAQLSSQQLNNTDGSIILAGSNGALDISAGMLQNVRGNIQTNSTLQLTADTLHNQSGYIAALASAKIAATDIDNSAGQILADTLLLSSAQLNNSAGQLLAGQKLSLDTTLLNNSQGAVVAEGQLQISADSLRNSAAGVIAASQVQIDATTLSNSDNSRIEGQQLSLKTQRLDNSATLLATGRQGEALSLQTAVLNNQGRIESHGDRLSLAGLQLNNRQGQIYHLGAGVLQLEYLAELNNQQGQLYSGGTLQLSGGDIDNNSGSLVAQQGLQLTAADVNNRHGAIQAGGSFALSAARLDNQLGLLAADGNMHLSARQLDNSSGQLLHLGAGTLNIDDVDTLTNARGKIYTSGTLALQARDLN
ncbi:MAG TPA: filamentous hemagglutinin N-terminal domain-containing protein, partial [Rheinheimera sp.]|nr:filamentous hemagglutinin N-terminal domain-containing protein [Rheinheimera sp.]